jgi:hypothetical protein
MINGHEKETQELSAEEILLATNLIPHFKKRGKDNPIKAKEIVDGVNKYFDLKNKFTDVRLRKIVNYYRVNGIIPIISTSNGYFVSYLNEDIEAMIISLSQRAKSITDCCDGLQRILDKNN